MGTERRRGALAGVVAYALWGCFPLYFRLLEPTGALEILAHRILWSLVAIVAVLGVAALGRRGDSTEPNWVSRLLADRRLLAEAVAAAACIATNWLLYVWAVNDGRVVDAALGYFINPLVTVALGVVVLGERLRRLQWLAVALGAAAVVVIVVAYGEVPWVSFALAVSFAGYGFLKRRSPLSPFQSLAAETTILVPVAVAALVVTATATAPSNLVGDGIEFGQDPAITALLVASGVVTATPLILFAFAAHRIPLSLVGLLQYLTPATQFVIGVAVFGEDMPPERLVGFVLIWAALAMLSADALRTYRTTPVASGAG